MAKPNGYSPDQIITIMREVEVFLSHKKSAAEACKFLDVNVQTYYHWRMQYGDLDDIHNRKFLEMEKEINRVEQLVADLLVDNAMFKRMVSNK